MSRIVSGIGSIESNIVFIGEAPGAEEESVGVPFTGKAGETLDYALVKAGVRREDVYITNVVKVRPPNNATPSKFEIQKYKPLLLEEISLIKPKVIVCLGKTATHTMMGESIKITRDRGILAPTIGSYQIMPTFHPAYVNRFGDKLIETFLRDVKLAVGEANERREEREQSYAY